MRSQCCHWNSNFIIQLWQLGFLTVNKMLKAISNSLLNRTSCSDEQDMLQITNSKSRWCTKRMLNSTDIIHVIKVQRNVKHEWWNAKLFCKQRNTFWLITKKLWSHLLILNRKLSIVDTSTKVLRYHSIKRKTLFPLLSGSHWQTARRNMIQRIWQENLSNPNKNSAPSRVEATVLWKGDGTQLTIWPAWFTH